MQKFLFIFFAFFATTMLAATKPPANLPENLSLKIDFHYTQHQDNKITDMFVIKNHLALTTTNHQWTLIPDTEANANNDRYVLLGQIESANSDEITMNFLILDMSQKEPNVISKPKITMNYGQQAAIALENGNEKIKISVLAKA